ncbi:S8 family serine peptidase [Humibacillus xanthopallidus]|uniref:S8 family serine peptidase n=1 Tax=Humibacillus xanthopallidus TaxID=412689 RepID=UPI0031E34173
MRRQLTVAVAVAAAATLLGPPAGAAPVAVQGSPSLTDAAPPAASAARVTPSAPSVTGLSAALAPQLAALPPGGTTTVVVTLRAPVPLPPLPTSRAARNEVVVRTLRARSTAAQAPLRARLTALAATGRVRHVTPLWVTNAISITATADAVREVAARPDVLSVTPDAITIVPASSPVEPNIATVGAPALWQGDVRGSGVVVATLDSGVDASHPDLGPRWRGGTNSWFDPFGQHPGTPVDLSGHGTATMGLIVGGDAGGTSIGMAPGARWIAARIFNDAGASSATAVHQAFQWVLDPDRDPSTPDAPQVVNGSWSIGSSPGCDLSFQPDVRNLVAAGILPVFAAGNFGPAASTSVSPANYPESFAVGGVDALDASSPTSSSGPSTCGGRSGAFPDAVAPGVAVTTADRFGLFQTLSGTSVAAPHVAGALALLISARPELSPERQRAALTTSAVDLGPVGPDPRFGSGRLDVGAALAWLRSAPDFTLAVAPTAASVRAGETTTYAVTASPLNGWSAPTQLTLTGLDPATTTWSFTPPTLVGGAWTTTLSVTPSRAAALGDRPFAVTGTASDPAVAHTTSAVLTVTAPPDFTVAASPSTLTLDAGARATIAVSVGSVAGWVGPATLSTSSLPTGVGTVSITPTSVSGSSAATVTVTTATGAPGGTYPVTVTATDGVVTHTATIGVTVVARDLVLSASPTTRTVARGGTAAYTLTVSPRGGLTGSATFTRSSLPSGATSTWTTNPVALPGTTSLRIRTTSAVRKGTYRVVVTATSGTVSRQTTLTLVVS